MKSLLVNTSFLLDSSLKMAFRDKQNGRLELVTARVKRENATI